MLFAQITDLHVTADGAPLADGISTNQCLAAVVAHLNQLRPRPDFVAITGDLVNTGTAAEYAMLARLLAPLTLPVYAIPGNHDDRSRLRDCFAEAGFFPASGEFLHYEIFHHPVRLIFLDTVVPGAPHGILCEDRLAWLADRLAAAPAAPTILFMHHPPTPTGIAHMDAMRCTNGAALAAVIERHPCVIRILCGHVHRPITMGWAGTVVTVGPSTAHHVALDLAPEQPARWTREPAAVSLHLWRADLGLISHLSYIGDHPPQPFG